MTGEFTYSRVHSLYRSPLLTEDRFGEIVSLHSDQVPVCDPVRTKEDLSHSGRTRPTTPLPVDFVLSSYFRATSKQKLFARLETRATRANKFPFTVN